MKDQSTSVDIYNETVNHLQQLVDLAFENRRKVHFNESKTAIIEAVDFQIQQGQALKEGTPISEFTSPNDPSVVFVDDPTFYPILLKKSLRKVHPDWSDDDVSSKAFSIIAHEFDHGGEAIRDPNLEELLYCVMFVEDIEDSQPKIQPFVMIRGQVDYQKVASAPGDDQSEGDKAMLSGLS
jgi:hypothetical protein